MALAPAWLKTITLPDLLPPLLQLVFLARPSAAGSHPISGRHGYAAVEAMKITRPQARQLATRRGWCCLPEAAPADPAASRSSRQCKRSDRSTVARASRRQPESSPG